MKCECRRPTALAALAPTVPSIHGQGRQRHSKQGHREELVCGCLEAALPPDFMPTRRSQTAVVPTYYEERKSALHSDDPPVGAHDIAGRVELRPGLSRGRPARSRSWNPAAPGVPGLELTRQIPRHVKGAIQRWRLPEGTGRALNRPARRDAETQHVRLGKRIRHRRCQSEAYEQSPDFSLIAGVDPLEVDGARPFLGSARDRSRRDQRHWRRVPRNCPRAPTQAPAQPPPHLLPRREPIADESSPVPPSSGASGLVGNEALRLRGQAEIRPFLRRQAASQANQNSRKPSCPGKPSPRRAGRMRTCPRGCPRRTTRSAIRSPAVAPRRRPTARPPRSAAEHRPPGIPRRDAATTPRPHISSPPLVSSQRRG